MPTYVPTDVSGAFDVGTGMFNLTPENTQRTRAAARSAVFAPMNQVFVGDSITSGWNSLSATYTGTIDRDKAWPYVFGRAFNARLGLPAPGTGLVRAFELNGLSQQYFDGRWAPGPNSVGIQQHGHYLGVTNSTLSFDSGKSGFTPGVGTAVGVTFLDSDNFKFNVDGGAWVSVAGHGTGVVRRAELHGLAPTTHLVRIQAAADQHVDVVGAEVFSETGASADNVAQGGSGVTNGQQDDWSVPGAPKTSMSATFSSPAAYSSAPSTVYIALGGNDLDTNRNDLSKIRDGILETANFYRGSDIVLIAEPHGSASFSTVDIKPLLGMLYRLAAQQGWPLWDLEWFTGGYEINGIRGMNGDTFGHLNPSGYAWLGATLAEIMSRAVTADEVVTGEEALVATGGATVGGLSLSTPGLAFGAWPVGETSPAVSVSVTNTGNGPVQVVPAYGSTEFKSTASRAGDCVQDVAGTPQYLVLDAGQTCFLRPVFAPTKASSSNTSVVLSERPTDGAPGDLVPLSSGAQLASKSLSLTASAAVPTMTLSPASLGFGHAPLFQTRTMTTVVKNTSTVPLQFDAADLGGSSPFTVPATAAVGSGQCITVNGPASVVAGASCTLSVAFRPVVAGQVRANLVVQAHRSTSETAGPVTNPVVVTATVPLSGTGDAPTFSASPTTPGFGNVTVGAVKVMTVTMKNTSTVPLAFTPSFPAPATYRAAPFSASNEGTDCVPSTGPRVVAAGGSCSARILFSPQAAGASPGTITIAASEPVGQALQPVGSVLVKPTGTGVLPTYTLSPTSLAFATVKVGASKVMSTKVSNTSTVALSFSPSIPGVAGFTAVPGADASSGDCATSDGSVVIAAGASCTIRVLFLPTSIGAKKATVTIAAAVTRDGAAPLPAGTKTVALTGTGG